jgi:hypothetical protein
MTMLHRQKTARSRIPLRILTGPHLAGPGTTTAGCLETGDTWPSTVCFDASACLCTKQSAREATRLQEVRLT